MTQTTVADPTTALQALEDDRFAIAVRQAAATMERPEHGERLQKALDFVLTGAVTLNADGTATVKSGSHAYQINGECPCQDSQTRSKYCKHYLAVQLLKRTLERLHQSPNGHHKDALTPQPQAPQSAAWHVNEAPASCCLKFQLCGMEILYTMRDTDDDKLFARVRRILPKIQEKVSTGSNGEQSQAHQDLCPIHNVPMKHHTKGKQSWVSHQMADDSWCRGA
jgi:hypothetical protein